MSAYDIKEVVRRNTGRRPCVPSRAAVPAAGRRHRPREVAIPSRRRSMTAVKPGRCRKRPCWLRSAAAIRPRWRELKPGETVLDLGSGGGIDVLLSARRVGPSGKAYGLDMTDEMLALARENQKKAGVANAEFLKGEIENIPLPDNSVDCVISNCVVNLSADKDRVLRESFSRAEARRPVRGFRRGC